MIISLFVTKSHPMRVAFEDDFRFGIFDLCYNWGAGRKDSDLRRVRILLPFITFFSPHNTTEFSFI